MGFRITIVRAPDERKVQRFESLETHKQYETKVKGYPPYKRVAQVRILYLASVELAQRQST